MEKLIVDRQKKIISKLVNILAKENTDLYYADSMFICNLIVEKIKHKVLPEDEYNLVKDMEARQIQTLLSYNSNCC